ncbi:glycoside hydrolase family 65 protein [Leptolyngbya sp. NK1-12]|uniref:Glycoside hydrolase family 65 protein n=1 Tax=Leptolyngbya sp. NK1-12 TaxID=2547451 RepID=A0AA96WKX0_9CYAN|nr:glycoside hydrolase family 65 protein [Leptolyngbya sp. NK1-12]
MSICFDSPNSDHEAAWNFVFDGYDPDDEGHREALCALGNGYWVTRAATCDAQADAIHYPGTYRAGLYNRLVTPIEGEASEDESLVNLPNWLALSFRIEGGDWFSIDAVEILAYRLTLNLQQGILYRDLQFRDVQNRQTTLREQRFVSMAEPHLAGLQLQLRADNWSGGLEIRSAIDGRVTNSNVERYAPFSNQHLEPVAASVLEPAGIRLTMRTNQSRIEVSLAARTRIALVGEDGAQELHPDRTIERADCYMAERLCCSVVQGTVVQIEKIAALYTSRDYAISESGMAAEDAIQIAPSFAELLSAHQWSWNRLWQRCEIDITPVEHLRALRLHIFHILQTISPHTADLDAGVPARGWHGEDYRGHIFWDEVFVLPFLVCRFPEIAREMLLYRYRRLNSARRLARQQGYQGAMYPWRSGSTGQEATPRFQFNLQSKRWMRDYTYLQRHINAIIICNLWHYYNFTNDLAFMEDYGTEMMIEIARFWASVATYNSDLDRYEIRNVVGPDEYHTAYPDVDTPGIHNNSYTNIIAAWTLYHTREALDWLPPACRTELCDRLQLNQAELDYWDTVSRKLRVVFEQDGSLSQYEGFDTLQSFDAQPFQDQSVNLILEAKGDDVNCYRVIKQADTAMLFFLLPEQELFPLMQRLGYGFDRTQMHQTITNHIQRTVHESSLSRLVYAGALAECDPEASWQLFLETLFVDISGASSKEAKNGIHLGAMAGTLHLLQHQYLGLRIHGDTICLDPSIPSSLRQLCMSFEFRSHDLKIEVKEDKLSITASFLNSDSIQLCCNGEAITLQPGSVYQCECIPTGTIKFHDYV